MFIIYGRRSYGRVDEWGGEHAQTSFVHVYYMPLIPNESFWVTRRAGGSTVGLPIRLNGKSILAAYLRTWAPLVAVIALASDPGFVTGSIAAVLGALALTSLTWSTLHRTEARRRSDFNLLAFGMRCDPALCTTVIRNQLRASLEERWAKLDAKQPPDDVARFGPANLNEAVIAYGLLRLAALAKRGGPEAAAAERLLAGAHDLPPEGEGPYRGAQPIEPTATPALHDEAAAVAAKYTAARRLAPPAVPSVPWWKYRGSSRSRSVLLAAVALGGIGENIGALRGARVVTGNELASGVSTVDSYVDVTCEDLSPPVDIVQGANDRVTGHMFACNLGDHVIALRTPADIYALDKHVVGKLHPRRELAIAWPPELADDPTFLPIYIDVHGLTQERIEAICAGVAGLLALALAVYWLRRRGAVNL